MCKRGSGDRKSKDYVTKSRKAKTRSVTKRSGSPRRYKGVYRAATAADANGAMLTFLLTLNDTSDASVLKEKMTEHILEVLTELRDRTLPALGAEEERQKVVRVIGKLIEEMDAGDIE